MTRKKGLLFIVLLAFAFILIHIQGAVAYFTDYDSRVISVTSGFFAKPYLMAGEDFNRTTSPVKSSVVDVDFVDYIPDLSAYVTGETKFDVSKEQDGTVMAWVDGTQMYIGGMHGIIADPSCNDMFSYYTSVEDISFGGVLDTTETTSARRMFLSCTSLTDVDLNNIVTDGITNFQLMFGNCTTVKTLDISSWDMASAKNMYGMFLNCNHLTKVTVGTKDVRGNLTFENMFKDCSRLNSVDLSHFQTRDATDYDNMFSGCSYLRELDLSGFQMNENATLSQMFAYSGLKTVYASSNWSDVVKNDCVPFWYCAGLTGSTVSDEEGIDKANYETGYFTYKAFEG